MNSKLLFRDATQTGRLLELQTPLGEDRVLLNGLDGREPISGCFVFNLDLLSAEPIPMTDLVRRPVSVSMLLPDGVEKRYFHGIIRSIWNTSSTQQGVCRYKAEMVPWLWLLTQKMTSRIFQDKTAVEIIVAVFNELKSSCPEVRYRDATMREHTGLDYCVQYRESDFNLVSRLMEQEGIFYFFEHRKDGHTLVFADHNAKISRQKLPVVYAEAGTREDGEFVDLWSERVSVVPGKVTMRDHHFQLPKRDLEVMQRSKNGASSALEIYDYPGQYALRFKDPDRRLEMVRDEGQTFVNIRMEEAELPGHGFNGSSSCRELLTGTRFSLTGHRTASGEYITTSVHHSIPQSPDYFSGGAAGNVYRNTFTCVPVAVAIRPARITPKPAISGPQTAVVAVKAGEESWIDKYGRVRVQFYWDRDGKNDESSACWIRVAQAWAGTGWGAHFWPRVGQEVVVEFLEGDPDRPIITGSVYNADNMPPYSLPDNYTRSGIITRSSKNGATKNFNELRFEDKAGHEQVFLNAERDMDHRVERDHRIFIGHDEHVLVAGLQNASVGSDQSSKISGNRKENIGAKFSLHVGDSQHQTVTHVYTLKAGDEIHLKSDAKIVIEGGSQVSLKGPGGFIDIGSSGIAIVGKVVNVNSGGSPGSGTEATPDGPEKPDVADDGSKGTKLS